jgi:uncharacterized RDD family membrane protein YckC
MHDDDKKSVQARARRMLAWSVAAFVVAVSCTFAWHLYRGGTVEQFAPAGIVFSVSASLAYLAYVSGVRSMYARNLSTFWVYLGVLLSLMAPVTIARSWLHLEVEPARFVIIIVGPIILAIMTHARHIARGSR